MIYPSEMFKKMNQQGLRCTKREERYAECKRKSLTGVTLAGPKRENEEGERIPHIWSFYY